MIIIKNYGIIVTKQSKITIYGSNVGPIHLLTEVTMKLLAIDGNSILNRAFYGIKLLTNKKGQFTNAIFGFMNIYLRNTEDVKPDAVAVAFDLRTPTFRHKAVSYYKANRKSMPPELAEQLNHVRQVRLNLHPAVMVKLVNIIETAEITAHAPPAGL